MKPTQKINLFIFALTVSLLLPSVSKAEEVIDPLTETQKVLRDKELRKKAIKDEGAKGEAADAYAEKVAGPAGKEGMYDISADLMAILEKESGGNPDKMMKILSEAQKDPEAFYNRFPPEQKEKFKKLIEKIPKQSKP